MWQYPQVRHEEVGRSFVVLANRSSVVVTAPTAYLTPKFSDAFRNHRS